MSNSRFVFRNATYEEDIIQLIYQEEIRVGAKDYHGDEVYESDVNPEIKTVLLVSTDITINGEDSISEIDILHEYDDFGITHEEISRCKMKIEEILNNDKMFLENNIMKYGGEIYSDLTDDFNIDIPVSMNSDDNWTITYSII